MPFTPTLNLNLTAEQLSWATPRWKAALDAKQTTAQSVEEWFWLLFGPGLQSQYDQQVLAAAISWKPEESVEVTVRRDDLAQQVQSVSQDQLALIEAVAAVQLDEASEVTQRRYEAVKQLLSVSEEDLVKVEKALSEVAVPIEVPPIEEVPVPVEEKPVDPIPEPPVEEVQATVEEVSVPVDPAPVPVPVEEKPVVAQPVEAVEVVAPIEEKPAGSEA